MGQVLAEKILSRLLVLAPGMMLIVLLARPIMDVDIFWQLRLGDLALDQGARLSTEPFAARHLGEPLAQIGWLAQIVLAFARQVGGWQLLQVLDALIWLGGLVVVATSARRFASPAGVLAALVLAFAAALPSASLRPQSFAVLCFGLMIALLVSSGRWQWRLPLCGLVLVLWQNLHPSVLVAVVYLGSRSAWMWIEYRFLRSRPKAPWFDTGLTCLAGLAFFATPSGTGLFALSARNAAASKLMAVTEWHPVWSPVNSHLAALLLPVPAIFLLLVALRMRRVDLSWLVPSLVLLLASAFAVRFSVFWAISSIFVLAPLFARERDGHPSSLSASGLSTAVLGAIAAFALVVHQPRFSSELPLNAIAALERSSIRGTVFAELPWGGVIIDRGYPDWRVALDGRYYVYTDRELTLARTVGTAADGLVTMDREWFPDAVLIHPHFSPMLLAQMRSSPGEWKEIYSDSVSVAFVRIKA